MADIKLIDKLPGPSPDLQPTLSYLRLGCTGCQHVKCFEIDGYDLLGMIDYDGSGHALGEMLGSLCLQGLPHVVVQKEEKEIFGHLECKKETCEHEDEIKDWGDFLNLLDMENQFDV